MFILVALGCSQGLNCTQGHPHLAGRLLHQPRPLPPPPPSEWHSIFLGAVLICGVRLPLWPASGSSAPLAASMLPIPFPGFSFSRHFPFLSVEKAFQEKYQKPHSQYYISFPFFLSQSPKQVAEVGAGAWKGGWGVGCEGVGWGVGCPLSCCGNLISRQVFSARVICFFSVPPSWAAHNLFLGFFSPLPLFHIAHFLSFQYVALN